MATTYSSSTSAAASSSMAGDPEMVFDREQEATDAPYTVHMIGSAATFHHAQEEKEVFLECGVDGEEEDDLDSVAAASPSPSTSSNAATTPSDLHRQHLAAKQLWAADGIDLLPPPPPMDKDKDLVVENSGEKVLFQGFLRKRYSSSLYMGSWRFCVVHSNNRLRWYMTQEQAQEESSSQYVRGDVVVKSVEPWNGHGAVNVYANAFAIRTTSNRVLLCSAKTPQEKEQWVQSLVQGVQKDRQYRMSRRHHDGHIGGPLGGLGGHHHHHHHHSHGPESSSAERRRIVPEDAVRDRLLAQPDVAPHSSYPPSHQSHGVVDSVASATPRQQASLSLPLAPPSSIHQGTGEPPRHAAASFAMAPSPSHQTTGCTRCGVTFGTILARRVVCGGCQKAFCSRHCNHKFASTTSVASQKKSCLTCVKRQEFLTYLRGVHTFLTKLASHLRPTEGPGDQDEERKSLVSIVHPPPATATAALGKEDDLLSRTLHKLRTAPMSLNKTIKILYQTRFKPQLFCVACERLPFYVEHCIDRVEALWYQILHLFQCCDTEFDKTFSFSLQLFWLQRVIIAICHRSPRIALQTIWHVQASIKDATRHHPNSLLLLVGFLYPPQLETPGIWRDILLGACPIAQKRAILDNLAVIHAMATQVTAQEPDSIMERWLCAQTVEQFHFCARELDASGVQLVDFQSTIQYDSLQVATTTASAAASSSSSSSSPLAVSSSSEGSPLEELVADQVRFVESLAAISERLRHVTPVADRSLHLVDELQVLNVSLRKCAALYPLCTASDELFKVLRVPPREGKVFSTKMRAPTLIFIEAVPVNQTQEEENEAEENGEDDEEEELTSSMRLRPFTTGQSRRESCHTFVEFESLLLDNDESGEQGEGEQYPPLHFRDSLSSSTASSTGTGTTVTPHHRRHGSQLPDELDILSLTLTDPPPPTPVGQSQRHHQDLDQDGKPLGRHDRTGSTPSIQARPSGFGLPLASNSNSTSSTPSSSHQHHHHARMENIVYDRDVYGESWQVRRERIRLESPFGHLHGWQLFSIIVKTNDDLRQEMFTMQLLTKFASIFQFEKLNLYLRTYRIVATGANIGLLETINDACSLDHLKKTFPGGNNLFTYFCATFGNPKTPKFEIARSNFIQSMAAYSIVSYVLLVKDRHNGNILLSADGNIIHIDFGFILGIAPGGIFSLEDAPFKLTFEMVEIMGGIGSKGFLKFRQLMVDGFVAIQKYHSEIAALLQTTGQHSPFPCFEGVKLARVVSDLRARLCVGLSKTQIEKRVDYLIKKSFNTWGTRQYDAFQLRSNNIQP